MILLCNAVTSPQCFLEDPKTFIKSQSYDLDWIYGQLWLLVLIFTISEEISKEA